MKKLIIIFIVALVALGCYSKLHNSNARPITPTEEKQLKVDKDTQNKVDELKKLQSPQLVEGKLRSVGKLTVLDGTMKYNSVITDTFLKIPIRGMTLDFDYSFGIGIQLQYIKVISIKQKTITLQIPKNQIQLMYIQMEQSSRIIGEHKIILVSQFAPSEVQALTAQSQQFVVDKIGSDQKYWMIAETNLENQLDKFCKSLGYQKVIFVTNKEF